MKPFKDLIAARTRQVLEQDRRIQGLITQSVPALAPHLKMARLEAGRLRLTVDTSAWSARGRFHGRQIIDALAREGLIVKELSWHVLPARLPVLQRTRRVSRFTADARGARSLAACAAGESDERLRRALLKLAGQLEPGP